jgi:hypothetical protein
VGPAEAVARHLGWVPAGCAHGQVYDKDTSGPQIHPEATEVRL